MSTPKTKLPLFNLQLVSDEEVAISLERLVDSVVMEVTAHRLALQPQQVKESNGDALGINSLPDEIIEEVFGYLTQNQLGQIASVCSRWNVLTRSPALWRKVDVKFHWSHKSHNTMTGCFLNMLPSCVTSIRLYYSNLDWTEQLNFEELCVQLQRRCPHLETLILEHVYLSDNFPSVIGSCNQFLPGLKILIFRHSTFSDSPTKRELDGISKIEVLDLSDCNLGGFQELQFSKIPQLRVLNLRNTSIGSRTFRALQNHGHNLEELYLCGTSVSAEDFIFSNSVFPHLKIICLHCQFAKLFTFLFVMRSCQSLEKVFISDYFTQKKFMIHQFFERNGCNYNIVEGVGEHHSHNLDHSYKKK